MLSAAEKFVSLVFDSRYDDADAVLRVQREAVSGDGIPRLIGLNEALRTKVEQLGAGPKAQRQFLAASYMIADQLREQQFWYEAESIFYKVVELSLAMNEAFFLNDARLRRVVCLKNLGRINEYERAKTEVPAGTAILIDGVNWRVEDL